MDQERARAERVEAEVARATSLAAAMQVGWCRSCVRDRATCPGPSIGWDWGRMSLRRLGGSMAEVVGKMVQTSMTDWQRETCHVVLGFILCLLFRDVVYEGGVPGLSWR